MAFTTSYILIYLWLETLNFPQLFVRFIIESLVTPGNIYPSSNPGVINSFSPYSLVQKKNILLVPTSQTLLKLFLKFTDLSKAINSINTLFLYIQYHFI
jgi:hypothetical protein